MSEPLTGGCACGAVRFEVTEPPTDAGICHCERCQRRSGTAASPNAFAAPGSVRITAGADRVRSWVPPETGLVKEFCEVCGSHLFSRPREGGDVAGIRMGAFDRDPGVTFRWRQWLDSAAPWEPVPEDGLPRFPERRSA